MVADRGESGQGMRGYMSILALLVALVLIAGLFVALQQRAPEPEPTNDSDIEQPLYRQYEDPTKSIPDPVTYRSQSIVPAGDDGERPRPNKQSVWWTEQDHGPIYFSPIKIYYADKNKSIIMGKKKALDTGEISPLNDTIQYEVFEYNEDIVYSSKKISEYFVEYLNEERQSRGLHELQRVEFLQSFARGRAHQAADTRRENWEGPHTDSKGKKTWEYLTEEYPNQSYEGVASGMVAENSGEPSIRMDIINSTTTFPLINKTNKSIAYENFRGFMESDPHREAMLSEDIDFLGVGVSYMEPKQVPATQRDYLTEGVHGGTAQFIVLMTGADDEMYPQYNRTAN